MPEEYCSECNRWFINLEALEKHMRFSSKHQFRCEPCDREFPTKEARVAHWSHNLVHKGTYCRLCQINYETLEELDQHYIEGVVCLAEEFL